MSTRSDDCRSLRFDQQRRFFGGGMKIAPEARLVDGLLDLIVIRKVSFARILADGPRIYTGTHVSLPEVDHSQVKSVKAWTVDEEVEVGVEVDGEPGYTAGAIRSLPGRSDGSRPRVIAFPSPPATHREWSNRGAQPTVQTAVLARRSQ